MTRFLGFTFPLLLTLLTGFAFASPMGAKPRQSVQDAKDLEGNYVLAGGSDGCPPDIRISVKHEEKIIVPSRMTAVDVLEITHSGPQSLHMHQVSFELSPYGSWSAWKHVDRAMKIREAVYTSENGFVNALRVYKSKRASVPLIYFYDFTDQFSYRKTGDGLEYFFHTDGSPRDASCVYRR